MRVEEIVGARVAAIREQTGTSQHDLGQRLGEVLDRPWSRQTVSAAEKGRRAFTAGDVVALAYVLDVPVVDLLTPPLEVTEVELPSGKSVPWRHSAPPTLPAQVLESLRRLEGTAARRAELEREERNLVERLIGRLGEADLGDEDRAAIVDAIRTTTEEQG